MSDFAPGVLLTSEVGQGQPLVLMPGGLTGWESWTRHQQALGERHRAIRVQPIHNERGSAGEPGVAGYDIDTEIQSLLATLDRFDIELADFAGWSSGGRALLEFAVVCPERIRSLTLVEPAAGWVLAAANREDAGLRAVNDFLFQHFGREVTEDDLAFFLTNVGLVEDSSRAREHPAWANWVQHRMSLSWVPPEAMRRRSLQELASIQAPTLVVRGSPPESWLGQVATILAEVIPQAEMLELEGGHAPHIVSFDAFMASLEQHLFRAATQVSERSVGD